MTNTPAVMDRCQRQQVNEENNNHRTWGDELSKKDKQVIRVMFQNINGFGYTKEDETKTKGFYDLMKSSEADIYSMAETNVDWRRVSKRFTIWEQTKEWFETVSTTASYNQHDRYKKPYQPGGTAVVTQGDMAIQIMNTAQDPNKLGRWSSALYRGKDNIQLRVVSVYCVTKPQEYGERKAFIQQQNALLKLKIQGDPITNFWNDFWEDVDKWLDDGEQLVLCGDWNRDVREEAFVEEFLSRNLCPAITGKHASSEAPETYNGGSLPIDEIFVSSTLAVTNAGYLEHGSSNGDHRPIWIDINKQSALGDKFPDLPCFQARRLKCSDPRTVKRYSKVLNDFYLRHDMYGKCVELFENFSVPLTLNQMTLYEEIDELQVRGMTLAEKKCRKLKMGNCKWSPQYAMARKKVKYIKASISKLKGRKVTTKYLYRLSKQLNMSTEDKSIEQLNQMMVEAKQAYNKVKENHDKHRETFLEDLALALEADGQGKMASNLKQLRLREQQRSLFRRLKRLKGDNNLSTTFVTVHDEDGHPRDIVDRETMENTIIPTNREKFHQCENSCPFLQDPLLQDFGFHGEKEGYNRFLNNEYIVPPSVDETTAEFINLCQGHPRNNSIMQRSAMDFSESWKKMNERTSSRQLHFGHFKACSKKTALNGVNYVLAEVPFQSGYSPERWNNATDVMILKKAGLYDVEKLRTNVLYEADFNHNNKWLGRKMMSNACEQNKIAVEQYSIPGKKSIDHALNRRLVFDITRYQKTSLAMTSCDLKSCYDRIVHVPAMMAMNRAGCPPEAAKSMFSTIQNARHCTRTAFGDSIATYGGIETYNAPVMGMGQGNGCGPQVWAVVSSVMFEILKRKGLTTTFSSPISKQVLKLCGFAFVDDTDLLQATGTKINRNDPEDTMQRMQRSVDQWEAAAKTTGGSISVDKSWYYLIHFEWKNGVWSYGDMEKILHDDLTCKDKDGQRQHLQYLSAEKAKEMLGVFLAPDGNNRTQIKEMKKKTQYLGELVRTGHLDRHEAWTSLTLVALKSIEYPLPALTLSEDECVQIMWPLLRSYLPKSGLNRHFPRDILYGQVDKHGIGLKNIYLTQGISHVIDIIHHLWHNSLTGNLIVQSLEQLRMEVGVNGNLFEFNYDKYKAIILTESWVQFTWKFLSDYNITFNPKIVEFQNRREGDRCIMQEVIASGLLSDYELKWFNKCRMYLKVVTLADIVTPDGWSIRKDILDGQQNKTYRQFNWPEWGKPPTYAWTIWRKFLRLVFTNGLSTRLSQRLGHWINLQDDEWEWFLSYDDSKLFQRRQDSWMVFEKNPRARRHLRFESFGRSTTQRPNMVLLPTLVTRAGQSWLALPSAPIRTEVIPHKSLQESLDPTKCKWLFQASQRSSSIANLLIDIQNGTAIGVSDGSYGIQNTTTTTAAWIVQSADGAEFISGVAVPPFNEDCKGAYRGEITGLLAIIHIVTYLCVAHDIDVGNIHIGCDNIRGLTTSFQWVADRRHPNQKHSDILSAISGLLKLKRVNITWEHIKAHQDDVKDMDSLSRLEQLNVQMDGLAKWGAMMVIEGKMHQPTSSDHPFGFLPVAVNNSPVLHEMSSTLYSHIADIKSHQWWLTKKRYNIQDIPKIHWETCSKASNTFTKSKQRFSAKWTTGMLATGKKMGQWKFRPNTGCPFCLHPDEDTAHILSCQHQDALQLWKEQLDKIMKSLQKWDTEQTLQVALIEDLHAWRNKLPYSDSRFLPPKLRKVIRSLRKLTYDRVLEGLLPSNIIQYQEDYYRLDEQSKKTGANWGKKVYTLFWDVLQQLWAGRNEQLHKTDRIKDLQGLPTLIDAIQHEFQLGIHRLPACEFSIYFATPVDSLIKRDISALRTWLLTIRLGRDLYGGSDIIVDEYSTNGPHRAWLGLPKL